MTFIIITMFLIIALGVIVAIYHDKYHEDICQFRIIEKDELFYIQRHVMQICDDGMSHSVWEYEGTQKPLSNVFVKYEFEHYIDALDKVIELKAEYNKLQKESFKDYLNKKRDDFTIIKYFE